MTSYWSVGKRGGGCGILLSLGKRKGEDVISCWAQEEGRGESVTSCWVVEKTEGGREVPLGWERRRGRGGR